MKPPRTKAEIRSVLGLFNFFRQFVANYAAYSTKLTTLTRKNSKWKGGVLPEEAEKGFHHLKNALLSAPTIGNPRKGERMFLHTDASKGTSEKKGMIGWAVIIWEIFGGEASKAAEANAGVKSAFNALRLIVLVGWAIYPLGYIFGYMMGSVDNGTLNIIYNLADFVNKILFGLIIWNVAVKESEA